MYNPNAIILNRKNTIKGVISRSKILDYMSKENRYYTIDELSKALAMSKSKVVYHLRLLKESNIVQGFGKHPIRWILTGKGQKKIDEFI
jgi:predicted transcriptional regulator